jgi:adenylylsulfate kinase
MFLKKIKINNEEGIFIWITGLAGSGKSTISRILKKKFEKEYGKTLLISGDSLRNIFKNRSYSKQDRILFAKQKLNFCKFILRQRINVIYSTISLLKIIRKMNKENTKNYVEVYIKTNIKKIISLKKKKLYHKKKKKNVWGIDLKPEFPTRSHIIIKNKFNKSPAEISEKIFIDLKKSLIIR